VRHFLRFRFRFRFNCAILSLINDTPVNSKSLMVTLPISRISQFRHSRMLTEIELHASICVFVGATVHKCM
jgi:hypothetical protein